MGGVLAMTALSVREALARCVDILERMDAEAQAVEADVLPVFDGEYDAVLCAARAALDADARSSVGGFDGAPMKPFPVPVFAPAAEAAADDD